MADTDTEAPATTHLLVSYENDTGGFSIESPQLPGFAFGRLTMTESVRDYQQVLHDLGVRGPIRAHRQERGITDEGGEYVLRAAEGPDLAERKEVLDRVRRLLETNDRPGLMSSGSTPTGEVVFVAAMPHDRVGDLIDQMYDPLDALVVCAPVIDNGVFTITLFAGYPSGIDDAMQTLEESGWTRDTTLSQVLHDSSSGRSRRLLVHA